MLRLRMAMRAWQRKSKTIRASEVTLGCSICRSAQKIYHLSETTLELFSRTTALVFQYPLGMQIRKMSLLWFCNGYARGCSSPTTYDCSLRTASLQKFSAPFPSHLRAAASFEASRSPTQILKLRLLNSPSHTKSQVFALKSAGSSSNIS